MLLNSLQLHVCDIVDCINTIDYLETVIDLAVDSSCNNSILNK